MLLTSLSAIAYFLVASAHAGTHYGRFQPSQCTDFQVTKDSGEGILRHCRDDRGQMIYLSGGLDVISHSTRRTRDLKAVDAVIKLLREQNTGTIEVVTQDAGGGDVSWHQKLIMAVEDRCQGECRIRTQVRGVCESACNQLHLTCAAGATTVVAKDGRLCEHATTGDPGCKGCDPKDAKESCNICKAEVSVADYNERCDEAQLLKNRRVKIDPERRRLVSEHAERLARDGVFDSKEFTCTLPPWAQAEPGRSAASASPDTPAAR